tara:strand:+ start:376 stop:588 length:213 start_codon:yes stop_codon:yes gene_type:complete
MQQQIARGYIKKAKTIKHKDSITNRFVAYKGQLQVDKKDVIVEVYSEDDNLKDDEIFIKLSVEIDTFRDL